MEVRLFGELEALDEGAPRPVRGAKQRALLALLALYRGEPVSADRLIDAVWGEDAPANPANALQAQIAQLRRTLGPTAILTSDAGYALNIQPGDVDIFRFEQLAADARQRARSGRWSEASTLLAEALALQRGEPLAEFAYAPFAEGERTRLEELTLAAVEGRAAAELALGRHREIVGDLEALCRQHPLREQLWESLILALYRSGRQAEALRAYAQARDGLIEELGIEPGEALRDLEARVLAQDPALGAPAAVSPTMAAGGNLRERPNTFVGRDAELDQLRGLLASSRLVTLIGPGGVGKTRLAIEAAAQLQDRNRDGAWLVELAAVVDDDGVVPAVAGVLKAAQPGEGRERPASIEDLLVDHVRTRALVIVLDNCEHVIGAVARLAERLAGAGADVRVIATSREALTVPGEVLVPVGGLAPEAAAELFVDRTLTVQSHFVLDDEARALVEDICRRLDGLPLAIELAAARLRALPLATLADRLDDRFRLLTGGARTALPRHQTLRAVVDWSYDLLFEDERRLFARLSAFAGGCDLDAAEDVCADAELPRDEIVDVLARLVDKSLVVAEVAGAGPARYTQLQTLWQYGRERLLESGEAERIRDRHAHWYRRLAEAARTGLRGREAAEWRSRLEADLGNLRSALEGFIDQGDAPSALALVVGVAWLGFVRADSAEAARWLSEALEVPGPAPQALRGLAMAWHALHLANVAGADAVVDESRHAVAELREAGEPSLLAEGLVLLSEILNRINDFEGGLAALAEARPLLVDGEEEWSIAAHDVLAAGNLSALGRFDEAEQMARSSIERFRAIGERWLIIEGLGLLAGIEEARGGLKEAAAAYEELVDAARAVGLTHYQTLWLMRLGALRARLGDDAGAEELFAQAVVTSRRPTYTGSALIGRAAAARRLGDLASSRRLLDEAMTAYEGIGFMAGVAATFIGLTWWALAAEDVAEGHRFAERACAAARESRDPIIELSAQTANVAVSLAESDTKAKRARLVRLLEERSTTGVARFARILGGAFGATLDEPDVVSLAAAHGLIP